MNQLRMIEQREVRGRMFSIYGDAQTPLFLAKDVASWIEHSDTSKMLRNIDEDEKLIRTVFLSGQKRDVWFLTEDGLYEVLMQSRKPIAKQFKKEVKKILKDIRRHGMYARDEILDNPDLLIQVATELKAEREERRKLQAKIEIDKPKVVFAEALITSNTSILVGELAKLLNQNGVDIGQNRLFKWLRDNGYLSKRRGEDWNMPSQTSMNSGLFEIKKRVINNPDGSSRTTRTVKVTANGQQYFINKFLKMNEKGA